MVSAYLKTGFVHFQQIYYKEIVYSPRLQNYKNDEEETPFCNALSAEKWQFVIRVKITHVIKGRYIAYSLTFEINSAGMQQDSRNEENVLGAEVGERHTGKSNEININ